MWQCLKALLFYSKYVKFIYKYHQYIHCSIYLYAPAPSLKECNFCHEQIYLSLAGKVGKELISLPSIPLVNRFEMLIKFVCPGWWTLPGGNFGCATEFVSFTFEEVRTRVCHISSTCTLFGPVPLFSSTFVFRHGRGSIRSTLHVYLKCFISFRLHINCCFPSS